MRRKTRWTDKYDETDGFFLIPGKGSDKRKGLILYI